MDPAIPSKVRVVVADDHAVVRSGIGNALRELKYIEIVGEAGDGPALLDVLEKLQPDFLVIDVTMPEFEPVSTIRHIRTRYPGMKILVVSAYDDDAYVQGLLGVGVNGYHLKDQPLSDLRLATERVLRGGRWITSTLIDKLLGYSEIAASPVGLTSRQRDLLRLLHQGYDNQTIARETGLSVKTVENHLTRIYRQINVQSRLEAARYVTDHPETIKMPPGYLSNVEVGALAPAERIAILLVDDNGRYRSLLKRMVGRVCPEAIVHEASNTQEALDLVELTAPRLVLVDVILGDEDGIRCTRRIHSVLPQTRIVLISAYPDREFHRLGMEAGAAAFVDKKDLDAAALRQMIDDVLD